MSGILRQLNSLAEITQGVEFVAIKPLSLRKEYKHAFGFVDFTSAEDMQAVYDAAKKVNIYIKKIT